MSQAPCCLEAAADARAVDGRGPLRPGGLKARVLEQGFDELGCPSDEIRVGSVELGLDAVHGLRLGGHGGECRRPGPACQDRPSRVRVVVAKLVQARDQNMAARPAETITPQVRIIPACRPGVVPRSWRKPSAWATRPAINATPRP